LSIKVSDGPQVHGAKSLEVALSSREIAQFQATGNGGGLNGSMQHWPAVYLPEFEIPTFFSDVDLSAARFCRALLENTLTGLFF
jgi:hypothetical protein